MDLIAAPMACCGRRTWLRLAPGAKSHIARCVLFLLGWGLNVSNGTAALDQPVNEYRLKAAIILNLVRFVEWPETAFPTPAAPITIGIVGQDPFGSALEEIVAGQRVNGRGLSVERYPNTRTIKQCQLLFISRSESRDVRRILAAETGRPVLTVSELEEFAGRDGGMVRLYVNHENKVRLQVNVEAVREEGLRISAKLLQLAQLTRR